MSLKNNKSSGSKTEPLGHRLERLYLSYNDPRYIHPDPLELVLPWRDVRDREIAALIASSFAYGRVGQILRSVKAILSPMESRPYDFVLSHSDDELRGIYGTFRHRFHSGEDLVFLLNGVRHILNSEGSLEACLRSHWKPGDETLSSALDGFASDLCMAFPEKTSTLVPSSARGSACKRLNLMLRWLIRNDAVDPGGWTSFSPALLLVPLDTHMHRIARSLHLTERNAADGRTALEITRGFGKLCPEDPVRFDFVLTRFGIHPDFERFPD